MSDTRKIWLVKFPTHQYVEDVKKLARQNNLRVVDNKFRKEFNMDYVVANPPKLTIKKSPKQKEKAAE